MTLLIASTLDPCEHFSTLPSGDFGTPGLGIVHYTLVDLVRDIYPSESALFT